MQTFKQGTGLKAIKGFQFTNPQTKRVVKIQPGASMWVTNPEYMQTRDGFVMVTRAGLPMGTGWPFTVETIHLVFEVIA